MRISTVGGTAPRHPHKVSESLPRGLKLKWPQRPPPFFDLLLFFPSGIPKGQLQNELITVRMLSQDAVKIQPKTDQGKAMVWPLQSLPGYHFPNELINTDWDSTKETEKLDIFSSLAGSVFGVKHLLPKCTWLYWIYAAAAKLFQSCPTLCNPIDGSPPGSPVPGILQARTLEWVAISFSSAEKWKVKSESEVAQSCPTLMDPTDCGPPASSVHGIFQARVLEWGAIAFSIESIFNAKNSVNNYDPSESEICVSLQIFTPREQPSFQILSGPLPPPPPNTHTHIAHKQFFKLLKISHSFLKIT